MARPTTSSALLRRDLRRTVFHVPNKPIRTVILWQLVATGTLAAMAAYFAGRHGALSALLGGAISVIGGLVFALAAGSQKIRSADAVLFSALRAEAAKIGVIVVLLWLVLALYGQVVIGAFLATFTVTVIIFSLAFFVRET